MGRPNAHCSGPHTPRSAAAAVVLFVLSLSSALAQGILGTKADPAGSSTLSQSSGAGIGSLFNVLLALGIVYGLLRYAMPKVMARVNRRLVTGSGSTIRIEETAQFAGGSLYVVSARSKTLLLAVGSQGVQNLADLTEPAKPEPETFGEIVDRAVTFQPAATHPAEEAAPNSAIPQYRNTQFPTSNTQHPTPNTPQDWAVALERLERLAN